MSDLRAELASYDPELVRNIPADEQDEFKILSKCIEAMFFKGRDLVNTKSFRSPFIQRFLKDNFIWKVSGVVMTQTAAEFIDRMEEAYTANPDYHVEMLKFDLMSLNESDGVALGWLRLYTFANPGENSDVRRDLVSEVRFERIDGKWYWAIHNTLRGSDPLGLSVDEMV